MVRDVATTIRPLVEKNGNRLIVETDAPGRMRADLTKVRQMLLNLLSNACKFTQGGTIRLEVRRGPGPDGVEELSFRIVDSGIGVPPAQMAGVLGAFPQAEASTRRRYGG